MRSTMGTGVGNKVLFLAANHRRCSKTIIETGTTYNALTTLMKNMAIFLVFDFLSGFMYF